MTERVNAYKTVDGRLFSDANEASEHELLWAADILTKLTVDDWKTIALGHGSSDSLAAYRVIVQRNNGIAYPTVCNG